MLFKTRKHGFDERMEQLAEEFTKLKDEKNRLYKIRMERLEDRVLECEEEIRRLKNRGDR